MEMPQGNSLFNYLKQAKNVISFFSDFAKQKGRTGPAWGGGRVGEADTNGRGEVRKW
jgi:hypothetical protein